MSKKVLIRCRHASLISQEQLQEIQDTGFVAWHIYGDIMCIKQLVHIRKYKLILNLLCVYLSSKDHIVPISYSGKLAIAFGLNIILNNTTTLLKIVFTCSIFSLHFSSVQINTGFW